MDKVLVAAPTYEEMSYCENEFLDSIKKLTYKKYDILIVENSENEEYYKKLKEKGIPVIRHNSVEKNKIKRLVECRNKIIEYALENDYDYILMLDSDVVVPKDSIQRLLQSKKEIVSGLYFNYMVISKKIKICPIAWKSLTEDEFKEIKRKYVLPDSVVNGDRIRRYLTQSEVESGKLLEVTVASAGCMLIKREVFSQVNYKMKENSEVKSTTTDDILFFNDAKSKGFKIYCDTSLKCIHYVLKKYKKNKEGKYILAHYINSEETSLDKEDLSNVFAETEFIK